MADLLKNDLEKIMRFDFSKFSVFIGQKSTFRCYRIYYIKDGIQINNTNTILMRKL